MKSIFSNTLDDSGAGYGPHAHTQRGKPVFGYQIACTSQNAPVPAWIRLWAFFAELRGAAWPFDVAVQQRKQQ